MRRVVAAVLLSALAGWPASAQEARRAEQEAVGASGEAAGEPPATLQSLAESVAMQVGRLIADLPQPRLDLVLAFKADLGGQDSGGRLAQSLRQLFLARLRQTTSLRTVRSGEGGDWEAANSARGAAAREGYELLLWLDCRLEANHLVFDGMLFRTEHHLWREVVEPERQVLGQVFVRQRVNAELRWFLRPVPSGPLSLVPYALDNETYVAVAVGDLDGDDEQEVMLLSPRLFEVRRLQRTAATVAVRFPLAGIPLAATRTRDPVGTLVIGPPGPEGRRLVALRTSDQSEGLVVAYDGRDVEVQGTISDFPVSWQDALRCTALIPGHSAFQQGPVNCGSLEAAPPVAPYYEQRQLEVLPPRGGRVPLTVALGADGTLTVGGEPGAPSSWGPFGTALGIADVNDDGVTEVLVSSDRDPGEGDRLSVLRFDPRGALVSQEAVGDTEGSVWVAGAGDADNDGLEELVAIMQTGGEARLLVVDVPES